MYYYPVGRRAKVFIRQTDGKYSFGTGLESRKTLGEYTFKGKSQITKTVSHSVTEDGFKDTINKTFYIFKLYKSYKRI